MNSPRMSMSGCAGMQLNMASVAGTYLEGGSFEQLDKEQLRQGDAQHGAVGKALPHQPAGPAVLVLVRLALLQLRIEPEVAAAARAHKQGLRILAPAGGCTCSPQIKW